MSEKPALTQIAISNKAAATVDEYREELQRETGTELTRKAAVELALSVGLKVLRRGAGAGTADGIH